MAKTRMVNTRFWSDNLIASLSVVDRYFFLYLLTNEHTNIAGVYELPLRTICFEAGLKPQDVRKAFEHLAAKVAYIDGWVCIKNFQKHQSTSSKTVQKGIEIEMAKIPPQIKEKLEKAYSVDTLSDPIIYLNLNSNLNLNINPNSNSGPPSGGKKSVFDPLGAEIIKAFEEIDPKNKNYYGNKTQRAACNFLLKEHGLQKTLDAIKLLPAINRKKLYIGQITTPYELQEKWEKVKNALLQEKEIKKVHVI